MQTTKSWNHLCSINSKRQLIWIFKIAILNCKKKSTLHTSSLSSLALWFFGSIRNSSVNRMHSWTLSGDTKSRATFMHDWKEERTKRWRGKGGKIVLTRYVIKMQIKNFALPNKPKNMLADFHVIFVICFWFELLV